MQVGKPRQRKSGPSTGLAVRLVNLLSLHQRVLIVTLHGSPQRVRARLPVQHSLLASSATYMALTIVHECVDASCTSPTSPLRGVLVQVTGEAPFHPEPFSLRGRGSSPPVQLPVCTQRGNARDAGSLVQPVLCMTYWSRVSVRPPCSS